MIKYLKRILPQKLKEKLKDILLERPQLPHPTHYCPICDSSVYAFQMIWPELLDKLDQYQFKFSIFEGETCNILRYSCPTCGESDRSRLFAIYMQQAFEKLDKTKSFKFIDFAPSHRLSQFIKSFPFINYRSADLYVEGVDDKVDLRQMDIYEDNSIDFFLCSHILEHIDEDLKAMKELQRILKPGGWGIVMVPIILSLENNYENENATSPEDRWKHFGQDDHVRVYSKSGFITKLESAAFKVTQLNIDYFGKDVFLKNGIHARSVLYIVSK